MSMLDQCPSCGGICGYTKKTGCQYRAEPVKSEWQPIETAPKDGTSFLVWRAGRFNSVDKTCWYAGEVLQPSKEHIDSCTHWMPLPESPHD
jgi:hypothetical protein